MMRPFKRDDGTVLRQGDWLAVDKGVGKFSGVWENPQLGLMCCLNYFRNYRRPHDRDTLWFGLKEGPAGVCWKSLEAAVKVDGPLKRNGKRPKPLPPEEPEPTIGELVARAKAAGDVGAIATIDEPWSCGACGFQGTILDSAIECDDVGNLTGEIVCSRCHKPEYGPREAKKPALSVVEGGRV